MAYLLSHLVDDAARRAPNQLAFIGRDASFTYAEVAARSNQLARLLIDHGVAPGDRVSIRMPRCAQAAIALYGISKAGAVYVPLDPHAPVSSARQVIEGCGVRVVLTSAPGERGLQALSDLIGLAVGEAVDGCNSVQWEALEAYDDAPIQVPRQGDDLAYILYSSGSTGVPKGIAHTHRSGIAYAELTTRTYGLLPTDRIGSHAPLHFDMATLGYLSGPFAGATTVVIADPYTKFPASLSQLIDVQKITVWYSVPLALVQMLERGVLEKRDGSSLRWVLFAGEPMPTKHLIALMDRWPQARFSNVYGPTEVNQCTCFHVDRTRLDPDVPIPIGIVWGDTEDLIVDDADQEVPVGEVGELLIRSATRMRGYYERPDLNATAFFDRPCPSGDVDRFYRTGDLVRRRPDGNLDFLGRRDRQIKWRGYRIELDGIERILNRHPSIAEAAAYEVRSEHDTSIQATVVPDGVLDLEGLTAWLHDRLPWYAVPSRVDSVDRMPRTTTDKLDRRALVRAAEDRTATAE